MNEALIVPLCPAATTRPWSLQLYHLLNIGTAWKSSRTGRWQKKNSAYDSALFWKSHSFGGRSTNVSPFRVLPPIPTGMAPPTGRPARSFQRETFLPREAAVVTVCCKQESLNTCRPDDYSSGRQLIEHHPRISLSLQLNRLLAPIR